MTVFLHKEKFNNIFIQAEVQEIWSRIFCSEKKKKKKLEQNVCKFVCGFIIIINRIKNHTHDTKSWL